MTDVDGTTIILNLYFVYFAERVREYYFLLLFAYISLVYCLYTVPVSQDTTYINMSFQDVYFTRYILTQGWSKLFFQYVRQLLTRHTTQSVRRTIKQAIHRCSTLSTRSKSILRQLAKHQPQLWNRELRLAVELKYFSMKDVLQLDISAKDADTDTNTHLELVGHSNPIYTTLPTPTMDLPCDPLPLQDVKEKQKVVSAPTQFANITVATGYLKVPIFLPPPPIPPVFFHSSSSMLHTISPILASSHDYTCHSTLVHP